MRFKGLSSLEQALSYEFQDKKFIIEALTHRSHFHENGDSPDNERLEFLGDAVLNLCITEELLASHPIEREGQLSKMRSEIVSAPILAELGRALNLGEIIRLGKGEDQSGGRERDSLLADTFEAVLGALFLDGGWAAAKKCTLGLMKERLHSDLLMRDSKSRLQEFCQQEALGVPTYQCLNESGPDHQKSFIMAVVLQTKEVGRGIGKTKKEATKIAAGEVLKMLDTKGQEGFLAQLLSLGFRPKGNKGKVENDRRKLKDQSR